MKLKTSQYEKIKMLIADLLEDYDIRKVPVDVFELSQKMHIGIKYASEIAKKKPSLSYSLWKYPDSYFYYNPETQKYIVFINDVMCSWHRQRFSLAHELIHIISGHQEQNDKNESEANFGASYLLAPTSLSLIVSQNDILLTPEKVETLFDVSASEAQIIVRYNKSRISLCPLKEKPYEKKINELLIESLNERIADIDNIKNLRHSQ